MVDYCQRLADEFNRATLNDDRFNEAIAIARTNNEGGGLWITGSFLYKTLISELYHPIPTHPNFDFLFEKPKSDLIVPAGWNKKSNRYGNHFLSRVDDSTKITFLPLSKFYSIVRKGESATLDNFHRRTLLNVQALTFSIGGYNRLEGDPGIYALEHRIVRVNDKAFMRDRTMLNDRTLREVLRAKGEELQFNVEYPLGVERDLREEGLPPEWYLLRGLHSRRRY